MKKFVGIVVLAALIVPVGASSAADRFAYAPLAPPWTNGSGLPTSPTSSTARLTSDVNGDGKFDAEIVVDGTWFVGLSTATGFSPYSQWVTQFGPYQGLNSIDTIPGDVTGDGKADAVAVYNGTWMVARSTGSAFATPTVWTSGLGQFGNGSNIANAVADVDGDGKSDGVSIVNGVWKVAISNGTGFAAPTVWTSSFSFGPTSASPNATTTLGDVNGDGRADAVSVNSGTWKVALSNGSSFSPPSDWVIGLGVPGTSTSVRYQLADVNGDGRVDAIGIVNGAWNVAISTGTGFAAPTTWIPDFVNPNNGVYPQFLTGDATGDGKTDAMVALPQTARGSVWVAPSVNAVDDVKASGSGWNVKFSDDFDGTSLIGTNWAAWRDDALTDRYGEPVRSQWRGYPHADEQAWYLPQNSTVGGGVLAQTVRKQTTPYVGPTRSYPFTTGMVNTSKRFIFKYGYVEARIKAPDCSGCWPAFFMLPAGTERPPEIDIFEFFPNISVQNLGGLPRASSYPDLAMPPPSTYGNVRKDYRNTWHTYGMLWTPDSTQMFVDGVGGAVFSGTRVVTTSPMYLIIQAAIASDAPGYDFEPLDGTKMETDYVRVYCPSTSTVCGPP